MAEMGQSLHIYDVRVMSACVPTAEVSVRRGKRRNGPKGDIAPVRLNRGVGSLASDILIDNDPHEA